MCGIAGWIDWERDLRSEGAAVMRMAETIACRGPDAEGLWLSPHAAFAHRRLSVIDREGGTQPMRRGENGRTCVINYNGELYNTDELRRELAGLGYTFRTRSDTEVVLVGYLAWGERCVERFNGIFAFAIWDEAAAHLFLARDRLGVKPLFWAERGRSFLFASELKALLAHPLVEPEVGLDGLAEVLLLGPARTPGHGVFKGVRELLPGALLTVDRRGVRSRRYWQLVSRPHAEDLEETAATVREILEDAVERQLVSDVPVCTFLSGGVDSSALTAIAARAYRRSGRGPLRTYSVDYRGNDRFFRPSAFQPDADGPWTERVSAYLETDHRAVTIDTPELVEALTVAVRARDLPGMADVDASLYLLCRRVKEEATVALSGECADEVFGGYPWFHDEGALRATTFPWTRLLDHRLDLLAPELREAIDPHAYLRARYEEALAEVPRLEGEEGEEARMREMFYLNLTRWMPVLLDRKDRMSMAVGLEVRVPFCDHRLIEYVWNVPWRMKRCDGVPKGLLRRALVGLLPPEVLARQKSPYPKTHNPSYLAATREWLLAILSDRTSPLLPLINEAAVRELIASDAEFDVPFFGQLMRRPQLYAFLAQVDTWLRMYRITIR